MHRHIFRFCTLATIVGGSVLTASISSRPVQAVALAAFAPPVIAHDPLSCMVSNEFPRIDAGVISASAQVERVRVYFKAHQHTAWYYVDMKEMNAARYLALLPQPLPETRQLDYYVHAIDNSIQSSQTVTFEPKVITPGPCSERPVASWTGPEQITVGGTKANQPHIPPGFSKKGIVAFVSAAGVMITGPALLGGGSGAATTGAGAGVTGAGGTGAASAGASAAAGGGGGSTALYAVGGALVGGGAAGVAVLLSNSKPTPESTPTPTPTPIQMPGPNQILTPTPTPTPEQEVVISSFIATPNRITLGESFTLSWSANRGRIRLALAGHTAFVLGLSSEGSYEMTSGASGYPTAAGDCVYEAISAEDETVRCQTMVIVDPEAGDPDIDGPSTVNVIYNSWRTITIDNVGQSSLSIGQIDATVPISSDYCSNTTVAPGGSCTFRVTCYSSTGHVDIPSNDPDENPFRIELVCVSSIRDVLPGGASLNMARPASGENSAEGLAATATPTPIAHSVTGRWFGESGIFTDTSSGRYTISSVYSLDLDLTQSGSSVAGTMRAVLRSTTRPDYSSDSVVGCVDGWCFPCFGFSNSVTGVVVGDSVRLSFHDSRSRVCTTNNCDPVLMIGTVSGNVMKGAFSPASGRHNVVLPQGGPPCDVAWMTGEWLLVRQQ
jgi:hypothetical protein